MRYPDSLISLRELTIIACNFLLQFWMSYELSEPKPLIKETFNPKQIHLMFLLTRALCAILVASIIRGLTEISAPVGMGMSTNAARLKSHTQGRSKKE
jgi:hypothetical protein